MTTTNPPSPADVILLVEDDPGDQELTRRTFAREGDHHLVIVSDGEEALDYLNHRNEFADSAWSPTPSLILLDLNMPRLDGFEFLEARKREPHLRRIPVVALSTSRHVDDIARAYALGVNSYISKPTNLEEFADIVRVLRDYWFRIVSLPPPFRPANRS